VDGETSRLPYLLRLKRESFWIAKVDSEKSRPYQLWQSIDSLIGRGSIPSPAGVSASDFHRFFDEKVEGVRASTIAARRRRRFLVHRPAVRYTALSY